MKSIVEKDIDALNELVNSIIDVWKLKENNFQHYLESLKHKIYLVELSQSAISSRCDKLQSKIENLEINTINNRKMIDNINSQRSIDYAAIITELKNRISNLEKCVSGQNETIALLQQDIEKYRHNNNLCRSYNELIVKYNDLKFENQQLIAECDKAKNECKSYECDLYSIHNRNNQLKERLDATCKSYTDLMKQFTYLINASPRNRSLMEHYHEVRKD